MGWNKRYKARVAVENSIKLAIERYKKKKAWAHKMIRNTSMKSRYGLAKHERFWKLVDYYDEKMHQAIADLREAKGAGQNVLWQYRYEEYRNADYNKNIYT